jgi:hypothetical protein
MGTGSPTMAEDNPPSTTKAAGPSPTAGYGQIPLGFEANRGQAGAGVRFLAQGAGSRFSLRDGGKAVLELTSRAPKPGRAWQWEGNSSGPAATVGIRPLGADKYAVPQPENEQMTKSNYFPGSDPASWITNVPNFARVRYRAIYPGIDLVYYGNRSRIEHDFQVSAGANPGKIAFAIEGAKSLRLDRATGDLILAAGASELRLLKPESYQEVDGRHVGVESSYRLTADGRVRFKVGAFDRRKPLVIDPGLSYSTFATMVPTVIAVDAAGAAYLAGGNVIEKVNPGGSGIVYKTTLGSAQVGINGMVADVNGQLYLTGGTSSTSFPTVTPIQSMLKGTSNAFVTKLDATGSVIRYSTYLGGTGADYGSSIGIDIYHRMYVTGAASSSDFPTSTPYQATLKGTQNAFVTALTPAGTAFIYSTYLGGSGSDNGHSIAVDPHDNVYVTGTTGSTDFPVLNPIQATLGGPGVTNAFVTSLNPAGTALNFSTYLGGSGGDNGVSIALDGSQNVYVAGETNSSDFPVTTGAYDTTLPGDLPATFVAKLLAGGTSLGYATFLGGSSENNGGYEPPTGSGTNIAGMAVDSQGDAIVFGTTYDFDYPTTPGAFETSDVAITDGNGDLSVCATAATVLTEVNPSGSGLLYSTFFSGYGPDGMYRIACGPGYYANDLAIDSLGNAYLAGNDTFGDIPITQYAFLPYGNFGGGFVSKFAFAPMTATTTTLTATPNPQAPGAPIVVTAQVSATGGVAVPGSITFELANDLGTPAFSAVSPAISIPASGKVQYSLPGGPEAGSYYVSAIYSGGINFTASASTLQQTFNITSTPIISLASGTYQSPRTVTITDRSSTPAIYYTTNGATPTTSSTLYSGPITVGTSETLKAIAVSPGHVASPVVSAVYKIVLVTATPTFSLAAGQFASPHLVSMTDATPEATIYYTTTGTTPSTESPKYTAPIKIDKTTTLQAMAIGPGRTPSAIESVLYTFKAGTPVFSVAAGTYSTAQSVALSDVSDGVSFYYTTDGTTPTTASKKYDAPIKVSTTETIKAIAAGTDILESGVASAAYVIK